jgi:hypothetical protein
MFLTQQYHKRCGRQPQPQKKLKVYVPDTAMRQMLWCLLGMQAGSMTPKAPSITPRINLRPNQGDASLKTSADGTSDITERDELRIC